MNNKTLKELLKSGDIIEEHDDFYLLDVVEEKLDDDSIDDTESGFMQGYLAE